MLCALEANVQAWAPLARGLRFDHPVVIKMREKYKKSAAQIFLRWGLQHVSTPHSEEALEALALDNTA